MSFTSASTAPKRKLTSKNLFDDVFAAIPATSYLNFGPQSLMEELAMEDVASPAHGSRNTGARAGEDDDDDDADALMFGGGDTNAPGKGRSTSLVPDVNATPWTTVAARGLGGGNGKLRSAVAGGAVGMQLEMDAEDVAFKEATKHAALLSEFKEAEAQQDAERAERHRQRLAEQVAAMTGEEERKGGPPLQSHQQYLQPGDRRGRQNSNNGNYPNANQNRSGRDDGRGIRSREGPPGQPHNEITGGGSASENAKVDGRTADGAPSLPPQPQQQQSNTLATLRRQMSAEEQLALMPPGLSRLYTGRCVMLRTSRGYGFISPDLGGPDVYFIKDSVALTFTRLALQNFYAARGMDVPPSAQLPAERWDAPELTGDAAVRAPLVVSSLDDLNPRQTAAAATAAEQKEALLKQEPSEKAADTAPTATEENEEENEKDSGAVKQEADGMASASGSAMSANPRPRDALHLTLTTTPAASLRAQLPSLPGLVGGLALDRSPVPPITAAEREGAVKAAALLTNETAQLLQWAMDNTLSDHCTRGSAMNEALEHGGGLLGSLHDASGNEDGANGGDPGGVVVTNRDALTFTVQRNRATGASSRLLRAEFIRGLPEAFYALPLEQSWFWPLFPGAIGAKSNDVDGVSDDAAPHAGRGSPGQQDEEERAVEKVAGGSQATSTGPILTRYTGSVRAYNAEDRRGYIRCDEPGARQDVCFYSSAFLWDPALPPAQHVIAERLRVVYSVAGVDRNGKYLATLVTSFKDGKPFSKDSFTFVEDERDGRGGGGRRGGTGGMRDEIGTLGQSSAGSAGDGSFKRSRAADEEEQMLLFEEDDYAMI